MVDGKLRSYVLYVPATHGKAEELLDGNGESDASSKSALWLAMHGTGQSATEFLEYSGLQSFAEEKGFAFLALEAEGEGDHKQFNVLRGSRADPTKADDLAFAQAVAKQVVDLPCIDYRRVHCTGYSNGARFCMQLASEMSPLIASVAPVAGLRYPKPNRAERAMPILAFHGTADPVNPWAGNGNPMYWVESVSDAYKEWAAFNDCRGVSYDLDFTQITGNVYITKYDDGCQNNAEVVLVKLKEAGHTWPGTKSSSKAYLGKVERDVNANTLILDFFNKHRLPVNDMGAVILETEIQHVPILIPRTTLALGALGALLTGAFILLVVLRRYHLRAGYRQIEGSVPDERTDKMRLLA